MDLERINARLETAHPQEILAWAWNNFAPELAATSSFQTQSVPLLHMIASVTPGLTVLFLDTGFHFPETLAFRDRLVREFGLHVRVLAPEMSHDGFRHQHGDLYRQNPDLCCYINKVEPLARAKRELRAWISGIRRDQTATRQATPVVAREPGGTVKICPLAGWTRREVWQYLHEHGLPEHPLLAQGYLSVGCAPCTRPVDADDDERAGRWTGHDKLECGLHLPLAAELPGKPAPE
jgi:phosphoadenosine phosphosulfate reductase